MANGKTIWNGSPHKKLIFRKIDIVLIYGGCFLLFTSTQMLYIFSVKLSLLIGLLISTPFLFASIYLLFIRYAFEYSRLKNSNYELHSDRIILTIKNKPHEFSSSENHLWIKRKRNGLCEIYVINENEKYAWTWHSNLWHTYKRRLCSVQGKEFIDSLTLSEFNYFFVRR